MTLGSGQTVQNSQCRLSGGSVSADGNNLQISILIAFSGSFAGAKNVYLYAVETSGTSSPYVQLGTWTIPAPPVPVQVTPASGSGLTETFHLTYSGTLMGAGALFNSSIAGGNACWIYYNAVAASFWLMSDNGSTWNSLPSGGTISNSQCTLTSGSAAVSGSTLVVTVSITFKTAFAGTKNTYLYVVDQNGFTLPYQILGTWSIPSVPASAISFASVASGSIINTTTVNIPITISSNPNRILTVGCAYYTTTNQSVSTAQLSGTNLTFLRRDKDASFAATTEYWYLLAPASGAGTVTITFSASVGGGCTAKEFYGVSQTTPFNAQTFSLVSGTTTQNPGRITTTISGAFVDDILLTDQLATPGSGQIRDVSQQAGTLVSCYATGHNGPIGTPGAVADTWNYPSSGSASMMTLVALTPYTASAGPWVANVNPSSGSQGTATNHSRR